MAVNRSEHAVKNPFNPWSKLLFLILFAVLFNIVGMVVFVITVVQFLLVVLNGGVNQRLQVLGKSLSAYIGQIVCFLTFVSDDKPFPFREWLNGNNEKTRASLKSP